MKPGWLFNVDVDIESTWNHFKTISQVDFKNNNLHKTRKVTNNPHSVLLKLRNPHNPHSRHSIKYYKPQATLPTYLVNLVSMWIIWIECTSATFKATFFYQGCTQKSQNFFTLMGSFWPKYIIFELQIYREVLKNDAKFEEKLTCQFKIGMRILTNVDLGTRKFQIFAL